MNHEHLPEEELTFAQMVKGWFVRPTPKSLDELVALELEKARIDLLKAERELEYWFAAEGMLTERIARLEEKGVV